MVESPGEGEGGGDCEGEGVEGEVVSVCWCLILVGQVRGREGGRWRSGRVQICVAVLECLEALACVGK